MTATSGVAGTADDGAEVKVPGEDCEQAAPANANRINRMAVGLRFIGGNGAIGLPYVDAGFILTSCRPVSPDLACVAPGVSQGELQ